MDVANNHKMRAHKKKKNKEDGKRKLEEDSEPEVVVETKKEKRKKKKELRERETEDLMGDLVIEEEAKKKKSKKSRRDEQESSDALKDKPQAGSSGNHTDEGVVVVEEKGVVVSGNDIDEPKYTALKTFAESGLDNDILECCKGFDKPSPIQSNSWPFLLNGRDLIGIAATGSGKTLAFGVPAMKHVMQKRKTKTSKAPLCLVLSPTRELAQQIYDVIADAGKSCGVGSVCIYGGTSKGPQINVLKSGVDIVIGTPGRLRDLIEMGICNLKEVSFVVLDEADRMLDMGFEPEVRSILSQTSAVRQMVMFSATWPVAVHQLAQEFMDPNPVKVVVGSEDLAANHDVLQIVEVLEDRARDERLRTLLDKYHKSQKNRVLVFVLYKKEAGRVENMLHRKGWKVVSIHGDKTQTARTEALSLFKQGVCPLMVVGAGLAKLERVYLFSDSGKGTHIVELQANFLGCDSLWFVTWYLNYDTRFTCKALDACRKIATDVAARGLDIPDVEVVINYSFPLTVEDYVHRIGRTGRAGKKGVAHTFFQKENKGMAGELVNVLREAGQNVPSDLVNFGTHVKKKESKLYGAHFREIAPNAAKATKITFGDSDED